MLNITRIRSRVEWATRMAVLGGASASWLTSFAVLTRDATRWVHVQRTMTLH